MGRKLPHDLQEKPLGNSFDINMPKKDHGNMRFATLENKGSADLEKTLDVFGFWKIIFKYPRGDFQVP